jgi:hypothetical protein
MIFRILGIALMIVSVGFANQSLKYISEVDADLQTPPVVDSKPKPGLRVSETTAGYEETSVYHCLYLPTDWDPDKSYPVIVEYGGNKWAYGDGRIESCDFGYGISGGQGFIWLSMPYLNNEGTGQVLRWWGDKPEYNPQPTIEYCKKTVKYICEKYNGDPNKVILAGFSRGSIACNYIGLYDDDIAGLWRCFIPYSHYDGVLEIWPYPKSDHLSAIKRFKRIADRPSFILANGNAIDRGGLEQTRQYIEKAIESTGVSGSFTYQLTGFYDHNDAWILRASDARDNLRKWLNDILYKD